MPASSVDSRLLRSGRIVGSIVLGIVFLVLVPTWLLGNLFVAAFPPTKNVAVAASVKNKANNTAPSAAQPQSSSSELAADDSEATKLNPANASPSDNQTVVVNASDVAQTDPIQPLPQLPASQPTPLPESQLNSQPEPPALPAPDFREWTNAQGKKVEAKFVRFVDDKIELTTANGKLFIVSPSIFSAVDQDYLKQFQQ